MPNSNFLFFFRSFALAFSSSSTHTNGNNVHKRVGYLKDAEKIDVKQEKEKLITS